MWFKNAWKWLTSWWSRNKSKVVAAICNLIDNPWLATFMEGKINDWRKANLTSAQIWQEQKKELKKYIKEQL